MRVRALRPRTYWRVTTALLLSVVFATGCGSDSTRTQTPTSAGPVSLTNCGTPVSVAKPPSHAVTMNQSATEIMLALGLADRMIGTAYLDDAILPEYAADYAKVPVLAKEYPSKEALLEKEPDFVYASFASAFSDEGVGERSALGALGVGTYVSPAGCPKDSRPAKLSMDDVFGEIRDIASIFGVPERAIALIDAQKARIAKVSTAAKSHSVLWWDSVTDAPSVGACCGTPGMIMSAVGADNEFADLTGSWADTSWEKVVERDPDVIVLVDASWDTAAAKKAFLRDNPTLKDLPAVVNQRFITVPFSDTSAGVRNVLGIEALATGIAALPAKVGS